MRFVNLLGIHDIHVLPFWIACSDVLTYQTCLASYLISKSFSIQFCLFFLHYFFFYFLFSPSLIDFLQSFFALLKLDFIFLELSILFFLFASVFFILSFLNSFFQRIALFNRIRVELFQIQNFDEPFRKEHFWRLRPNFLNGCLWIVLDFWVEIICLVVHSLLVGNQISFYLLNNSDCVGGVYFFCLRQLVLVRFLNVVFKNFLKRFVWRIFFWFYFELFFCLNGILAFVVDQNSDYFTLVCEILKVNVLKYFLHNESFYFL